jgi:hypothetical protein
MSDSATLRSPSPSQFTTPSLLIWSFFRDARDGETAFFDSNGRRSRNRYCLKCETDSYETNIFCTAWTSNAKQHLLKRHNVNIGASEQNTSMYIYI